MTKLGDVPEYFALSCCWGDQTNPICIKLDRHLFPVGVNLYLALRRPRDKSEPEIYWVDAICIDQANTQARGHQVSMMRAIYESARGVVVWLGEEACGSALGMDLIRIWAVPQQILVDYLNSFLSEHPAAFKRCSWEAMEALFDRPWWDRVWVYQEIMVSRDAFFVCGQDILDWKDFLYAILNCKYLSQPDIFPLLEGEHCDYYSKLVSVEQQGCYYIGLRKTSATQMHGQSREM
jgi:hypothetical protein